MTSDAKIAANRANARKSTGPRTERGKEKSRLNAVMLGIYAITPLLPGEDQNDYREMQLSNLEYFTPVGPVENLLVNQISAEQWKLGRIDRANVALGKQLIETQFAHLFGVLDKKAVAYAYSQLDPNFGLDKFELSPVSTNYIRETVGGRYSGTAQKVARLNTTDKKFIDDKIDQIFDAGSTALRASVPASERAPQENLDRQRRTTMRVYLAYVAKLAELQEARQTVTLVPGPAAESETTAMTTAGRVISLPPDQPAKKNYQRSANKGAEKSANGAPAKRQIRKHRGGSRMDAAPESD